MSDTPRTDATNLSKHIDYDVVSTEDMATVEKELNEAREELADYKASAERARDVITQAFLRVAKERDEAQELARELRDALEFMLEGGLEGPTPQAMRGAQDVLTKAEEVLP